MSKVSTRDLEARVKESYSLLGDAANIQIWHAKCKATLMKTFPQNTNPENVNSNYSKIFNDWDSVNLEFNPVIPVHLHPDEREYYSEFQTDGYDVETIVYEYIGSPKHYEDFYKEVLITCRKFLLDSITYAKSDQKVSPPVMRAWTMDFGFIDDKKLRDWCRVRKREADICYIHKTYYPCMVLLGGVLEGILLSLAEQQSDSAKAAKSAPKIDVEGTSKPKAIKKWSLNELIEVARELEWIGDASKFLFLLRDYRNRIHPGNASSEEQDPDVDSIDGCYIAVNKALSNIQNKMAKTPLPKS